MKKIKANRILVLNGSNMNMLSFRDNKFYGENTYEELCKYVKKYCDDRNLDVQFKQSNYEGELIDWIHKIDSYDYLIINPAGYSHTSVSIRDAFEIARDNAKYVIEVHMSNIHSRDDFRRKLMTGEAADVVISGMGKYAYTMAVEYISERFLNENIQ